MTPKQKVAVLFARAMCAMADIEGMKAVNAQRQMVGAEPAYYDFSYVLVERKITPEDVEELFGKAGVTP